MAALADIRTSQGVEQYFQEQYSSSMGHSPMSSASSSSSSSSSSSDEDPIRKICKRKIEFKQPDKFVSFSGQLGQPLASVQRRNQRERNRVRMVNEGYKMLRGYIPSAAKNKKMSKVETLKCAVEHIKYLMSMLDETKEDLAVATRIAISPALSSESESIGSFHYSPTPFSPSASEHSSVSSFQPTAQLPVQPESLTPPCSTVGEQAMSPESFKYEDAPIFSYEKHMAIPMSALPFNPYCKPLSTEDDDKDYFLMDTIAAWEYNN